MKLKSLLRGYKFSKIVYSIAMPIFFIFLLIKSILAFKEYPNMPSEGWRLLIIAVALLIGFLIMNKYMSKKIADIQAEIDAEEKNKNNANQ